MSILISIFAFKFNVYTEPLCLLCVSREQVETSRERGGFWQLLAITAATAADEQYRQLPAQQPVQLPDTKRSRHLS